MLYTTFQCRHIVLECLPLSGRMGNQCPDQRQDVLDPVVELFIEDALAHFCLRSLAGEQLVVVQHHFDDGGADGITKLAILLGPGQRMLVNGFFPDGEAFARCQTIPQRPAVVGLVRVPRPGECLDDLLAEEDQVVPRCCDIGMIKTPETSVK